jgi:hypothetical protein
MAQRVRDTRGWPRAATGLGAAESGIAGSGVGPRSPAGAAGSAARAVASKIASKVILP